MVLSDQPDRSCAKAFAAMNDAHNKQKNLIYKFNLTIPYNLSAILDTTGISLLYLQEEY